MLVPCVCWRKAFGVRAGKLRVQRASTRCERHDNGLRCAVVGAGVPHHGARRGAAELRDERVLVALERLLG